MLDYTLAAEDPKQQAYRWTKLCARSFYVRCIKLCIYCPIKEWPQNLTTPTKLKDPRCMYVCSYVCLNVCTYVCIPTYIYIYIYIHMYEFKDTNTLKVFCCVIGRALATKERLSPIWKTWILEFQHKWVCDYNPDDNKTLSTPLFCWDPNPVHSWRPKGNMEYWYLFFIFYKTI